MPHPLQRGDVIAFTNVTGADLTAFQPVLLGSGITSMVGVTQGATLQNAEGEMAITGAWGDMPKKTAQAWTTFDALYWDNTAKEFTTTSTGNTHAGWAAADAASADAVGAVRLRL